MLYIKDEWNNLLYYERNKRAILNRANNYCESNKDVSREKAKNKYRGLSEEEKNVNREETGIIICLKKEKQRLKEY